MVGYVRRRYGCLLGIAGLIAGILLLACPRGEAGEGKLTLRLAYGVTEKSALGRNIEVFAKRVAELTNGQVTVQVFPNSTLLSDTQAIEALQTGTVDLAQNSQYGNAVRPAAVFDLPYLFRDYEHWRKTVHGKPGEMVADEALKVGLHVLGYRIGGWRDVYGSRPIASMADFKGVKIRTIQTPTYVELFKALGAIPTPMAWPEVYLALQQKTVDAAETSLTSMYDAKHHEVSRHVILTHHGLTTNALLISERRWQSLPKNVQDALAKAARETDELQHRHYLEDDAKVVQQLKDAGLTVSSLDQKPFMDLAKTQVYPKLVQDRIDKALLDEVQKQ